MNNYREYLGDGLYVDFDGYQYRLFTLEGQEVFLEPAVVKAFESYQTRIKNVKFN